MDLSYRAKMRLFVPLGGVAGAILGSLLGIALLPDLASIVAMAGAVLGVLAVGLYYAAREAAAREREEAQAEREREGEGEQADPEGGEPRRDGNRD
jgi:hypothetical protein